ncbi:leucine-rich repeat-containing protein 34-like [Chelonus insularis]|uniref:leucine-rich repeat-containing protein 34-like n=1 Tax=Chelonus insularis TaxID=460826 RepID=UPI001589042F|nr:leucine-rich repeat-containing protein 34-like [Chelonus insularis]
MKELNDLFFACFCIEKFDQTRELILNGNDLYPQIGRRLDDNDIENLISFLKTNPDVKCISLAYNNIHCEGFIDIIDYIITNDQIVDLNMQNNEIGVLGIEELCKNGSKLKFKSLRLNGNKFRTKSAKKIALMLLNNPYIEHLDVAEVDQTLSSLIYFITVLRPDQNNFNNTLKVLDLSRPLPDFMQTFDSFHFATLIGAMLKVNTSLTELHLQKCNFSCHDIESMCVEGKYNKTLHLLDLGCNNIGDHGIKYLCNWLHQRPILAGIILCHNIITNDGARELSFALPYSRVRLLDISYNNISDDGMANILYTLKKSTCMRDLRIFGNRVSCITARILNRMFKSGVLNQCNVDVKIYQIEGELRIARNPVDTYKQRYYNVSLYGIPQPLQIVHEKDILDGKTPPKIIFKYIDSAPIKPSLKR